MIFVTGGTGFVGHEVVGELVSLGHRVRLLVRDARRAQHWAHHPQVEIVEGDALRPETLPAALDGVDAVIHLIGIIAETSKVSFEQGHVETTRHVLAAAKKAGVTRWIQMSAAGTRPNAISRYHITKWQAEELVRQSGLDWTIFRPSLIYGHDEHDRLLNMLGWLLSLRLLPYFPLLDGGSALVQPVSVREVARCFAHAIARETSIGRTYELVGPASFSWREMTVKIAMAIGRKTVYENFPARVVLRKLLGLAILLLPALIIAGVAMTRMTLIQAEMGTALWVILILLACLLCQRLVLFNLPSSFLLVIAGWLNHFAPRSLQMSEQLKMAREDNVGDARPAAETFGYTPETFEQGLKRILGKKRVS